MSPLFDSKRLNDDGVRNVAEVRAAFDALLAKVETLTPSGRELAIVKTKLEEACFFAVKGIAVFPTYQADAKV